MLSIITEPPDEPITLDEAKRQLRMDGIPDDDGLIQELLIPAVRERAEYATRRQLLTATWEAWLPAFPCGGIIELPRPPLQTVVSVAYVDGAGAVQTLDPAGYTVVAPAGPKSGRGVIQLVDGAAWPSTRRQIDAVRVRFTAGYGEDPTSVPARLRMAMLQDLATLYRFREDLVAGTSAVEFPMTSASKVIYRSYRSYPRYSAE